MHALLPVIILRVRCVCSLVRTGWLVVAVTRHSSSSVECHPSVQVPVENVKMSSIKGPGCVIMIAMKTQRFTTLSSGSVISCLESTVHRTGEWLMSLCCQLTCTEDALTQEMESVLFGNNIAHFIICVNFVNALEANRLRPLKNTPRR